MGDGMVEAGEAESGEGDEVPGRNIRTYTTRSMQCGARGRCAAIGRV